MREARHTTKGFFILSLVNGRLTRQRTPLKENNQILYDNRPSFKILSLIPYETSKWNPRQCTNSISQLSLHTENAPTNHDAIWDLVHGVAALRLSLKSELALSLSRGVPGQSLQSHRHFSDET